jgi:hypothetical protein
MLAAGQLGGLWGQRGQQGGRVVAAAVDGAVDEQSRRARHLARGQAAVDIARVGALVIAVLDDQVAGGRAANMIGFLVQRRQD